MSLTFKQRIVGALIVAGLVPVLATTAVQTYFSYQTAVALNANGLTSTMQQVSDQVSTTLETLKDQQVLMARMPYVLLALKEFSAATNAADLQQVLVDDAKLQGVYAAAKGTAGADNMDSWMVRDGAGQALQALYLLPSDSAPATAYAAAHARFDEFFRKTLKTLDVENALLVDRSGRVVYATKKGIDFGSSLLDGSHDGSALTRVVRKASASKDGDAFFVEDYAPYLPRNNANLMFGAVPIMDGGSLAGVLIFEVTDARLNKVFSGIESLGKTAEGFVYRRDYSLVNDAHTDKALKAGMRIPERLASTFNPIWDGFSGTKEFTGHTGDDVFGAMEQIRMPEGLQGLQWGLIVNVFRAEMLAKLFEALWFTAGLIGLSVVLMVLFGMWLAGVFVRPIQTMAKNFNASAEKVGRATGEVGEAVSGMIAASEETSAQSTVIRRNSTEAAGYVSSVSNAIDELNVSINDISQSIGETNLLIDDAVNRAQLTDEVVKNLGVAGRKISEVVGLINDLAEQTNLLALNAAIEAARAGDAGRGFAVVADEVKKLASHTSDATVEIAGQVRSIQQVSEQSEQALRAVVESIHRIRDNATTVSAAVEEQGSVVKQIAGSVRDAAGRVQQVDENMVGIEQAANDTGVAADQVSSSVNDVQQTFGELRKNVQMVLSDMGVRG